MKQKVRIWTGPCSVDETGKRLAAGGVEITCIGTEHVHAIATSSGVDPEGAVWNIGVEYERIMGHRASTIERIGNPYSA